MPEKSVNEIPRDLRELYQKGSAALQRNNLDYALAIFDQVLKREPAFFECRQALRATQYKKAGGKTSLFKKLVGGAGASPLIAKAQISVRKHPVEAVATAEQVLNGDPTNSAAHKIIAEAALEADFPKTACLSLEILLKAAPKDYDLSMQYGQALSASGQVDKAEQIYTELQRAFPNKGEIAQALKDLSARTTLQEGGYDALSDGQGSYRDILKDKDQAVALEQQSRAVKTDDVAANLITEYEARLRSEPDNLKMRRNLAELYTQKKDFDKALDYYNQIRAAESGSDPSLERAIAETTVRKFDHLIGRLDPNVPAEANQRTALQTERDAYQLDECKDRAERYPTDLAIRFELGELYFKAGKVSEAIQEFQKAQNYPAKRIPSMRLLGQCFAQRGMHDMAARKLQEAIKEKPSFDDEKKELVYHLGCVLEKMEKKEEAIEQFKLIYEQDISYRDVAAKVDAYYAGQG